MAYKAKIAASKLAWGVKLFFEQAGVGDGYGASGSVTTYKISQEEILDRYGPPKGPRQARNYTLYNFKLKEREKMVAFETVPKKEKPKSTEKKTEKNERHEEMNIVQAIDLHDELEEEVDCLDYLLTKCEMNLTQGIKLLLDERRCEMAKRLHRIHQVFEETKVAI